MKSFVVHELETGRILRAGTCPDDMLELQAGPGEGVIEGSADDQLHIVVDGQIVDRPAELAATPDYVELRIAAYPSIGDQLDAIWTGGQAFDDMRAQIAAVKAKYPTTGGKP